MKQINTEAVSPVVGVMLMLVVTLIIAAVVSGFAGGLANDEEKAPAVSLTCKPVVEGVADMVTDNWKPDYPANFEATNGLLFTHNGGEGFSLRDIAVQIQSQEAKITININDAFNESKSCVDDTKLWKNADGDTTYFFKVGGSSDEFILPGDKFMIVADSCRIDDVPEYGFNNAKQISWNPLESKGGFGAYFYTTCEYEVLHKPSGKTISSGTFVLQ